MKLTKFEGIMDIKGAQITVEFADGVLSMKGVPGEWATALATHVGRFRPKLSYAEKQAAKKGSAPGKNGAHGARLGDPIEVVHAAPVAALKQPKKIDIKAVAQELIAEEEAPAKRHTKAEVQKAARTHTAHEEDEGSEPHTVSEPEVKSSNGPGRIAVAKQVSEIVDALIEDNGIKDVEQLVAECQKLQAGGHAALARVANLDDRVRRRAILAGLEA